MLIGGFCVVVSSSGGIAAKAGGSCSRVSSASCHWHFPSRSHAQKNLIQDTMSTAPANDIASADKVLTTTFWIFLECHTIGFTMLLLLSPISLWQDMIIIPWWESGTFSDANDASENATNRKCSNGMGCIFTVTSANIFASCKVLLASSNVATVALLMFDCNHPKRLARSGLVLMAAYCKDPIKARKLCLSPSVTASCGVTFRSFPMEIGVISFTYFSWLTQMALSCF